MQRIAGRSRLRIVAVLAIAVGAFATMAAPAGAETFGQIGHSWGAAGTTDGTFYDPSLLAADGNSVYVLNGGINGGLEGTLTIQKFSQTGTFEAATAPISKPEGVTFQGIAVDPTAHRFYLLQSKEEADTSNGHAAATQILAFSTEGTGTNHEELASLAPVAIPSPTTSEALDEPVGMTFDPSDGDLVVLAKSRGFHPIVARLDPSGVESPMHWEDNTDETLAGGNAGLIGVVVDPSVGPRGGTTYLVSGGPQAGIAVAGLWELPPGFTAASSATPVSGFATEREALGSLQLTPESGSYGPSVAISPNGETLFWKRAKSGALWEEPGSFVVAGFSLASHKTSVVYGGGSGGPEGCKIETEKAALATSGEKLIVLEQGPLQFEEEKGTEPAYGDKILTFGPGGGHCPAPRTSFKLAGSEASTVTEAKGEDVVLEASAGELNGATPSELEWTVTGPESFAKTEPGSSLSLHHRFLKAGTYEIGLSMTVTGSSLGQPPVPPTKTLVVEGVPPSAAFSLSTASPAAGAEVQFNAGASLDPLGACSEGAGCEPTHTLPAYHWNFGDGSAEVTTASPTIGHVFSNPTASSVARSVTLTVTNVDGLTSPANRQTVTVGAGTSAPPKEEEKKPPSQSSPTPTPAPTPAPTPTKPKPLVCKKGFKKKEVKGVAHCVKEHKKKPHKKKHNKKH
jgi:hypothetical protein